MNRIDQKSHHCCCCCCLRDSSSILVSWAPLRSSLMVVCAGSVSDEKTNHETLQRGSTRAKTYSKCLRIDAPLDQGGAYRYLAPVEVAVLRWACGQAQSSKDGRSVTGDVKPGGLLTRI